MKVGAVRPALSSMNRAVSAGIAVLGFETLLCPWELSGLSGQWRLVGVASVVEAVALACECLGGESVGEAIRQRRDESPHEK